MSRNLLERLANVMIVGACAAVIVTHVHSCTAAPGQPEAATYVPGETIPDWAAMFPSGDGALVLYVNSRCQFCTASMPFYAHAVPRLKSGGASVVVASREPAETTRRYLREHSVEGAEIVYLPAGFAPKLRLTPAILLIDETGRVENAWHGQLAARAEREVLAAAGVPASTDMDVRDLLVVSAQLLAAVVLAFAAVLKLRNPQAFLETLRRFQLPSKVVRPLGLLLPWAELAGAAGLLSAIAAPSSFRWGAGLAMALFAAFGVVLAVALLKGRRDLSCGCFGREGERISWLLVGRCGGLFMASAAGLLPANEGSLSAPEAGVVVAAAGVVAAVLLLFNVLSTVWHLRQAELSDPEIVAGGRI